MSKLAMSKPPWSKARRTNVCKLWLVLVPCVGLLACKAESPCEATVSIAGKSATGTGENKQLASQNACRAHCVAHDPLLDAKHRVWKAAGGKSSGNKASDIEQVAPLKRLRAACEQRRRSEVKAESVRYQNCGS